jgi:hypothetical protein
LYRDLRRSTEQWADAVKRDLLVRYLGFPFWDILVYPLQAMSGVGERDHVEVLRMSPEDVHLLEWSGEKLKGVGLHHFGAFFDRLFSRADLAGATIIYTSDHGQDLHERGNQGLNTHCSSNPVPEEGLVPMVVIEGAGLRTLDWSRTLAANRDKVSHYQIFPTLLALMGYSPEEVRPIYGASLAEPSRDPFTFNTRFNARLGREPAWFRIDLDKVQEPPASDAPSGG